MNKENYTSLIDTIIRRIIAHADDQILTDDYNAYEDDDFLGQVFTGEAIKCIGERHIDTQFWQGVIANCSEPELCFDHQYRKDTFRDFALACLLTDVCKEYNNRVEIKYDYEFWNRAS